MPPKTVKKFCGIAKFIQQNDKDLYQALDDLCLFGLFRPRGRGVTFLYPSDKSYRKKIIDTAYSNSPENAVDMVRALILIDYLPSAADFKNKKEDISNALHKKLEVESADSKEVKLKSGHKLVIDSSYLPLRSSDNIAIYILTGKGELPTTGVAATMKYNNSAPNTRVGGGADDSIAITKCVEKLYASGNVDVFKAVMSIIYSYAVDQNTDSDITKAVYDKVCASARASFYNVLAPWRDEKDLIITNMITQISLIDLIACNNETSIKLISSQAPIYNEKLKELIIKVKGSDPIDTTSRDETRRKLIALIKTPMDARLEVLTVYNSNTSKLYKDLLTVYCYLAAINEALDSDYFTTTFVFAMQYVFNHNKSFQGCNETVYNLSIYYNLVKSDAFLYEPVYSVDHIDKNYIDLHTALPNPNDATLITIQFNSDLILTHGGGSNSFFGGIVNSL
jgi:hypothetical protein